MRPIDADHLTERIRKIYCTYCDECPNDSCENIDCKGNEFADLVDEAGTVDTYRFTFCNDDPRYSGRYAKFTGTYKDAREKMVARFGNHWAFQYDSQEWIEALERANARGITLEFEIPQEEYENDKSRDT